ncbi:MAG: hypothetical protein WCK11_00005 [Candidatus Falkowbacteria bacterium]
MNRPFASFVVILSPFFSSSALFTTFSPANEQDDYPAYFVFPGQMLETGSMGNNPFSDRRLTGALGGQSFLDTFVLSVLPYDYLNLSDRGVGWLILILVMWELFRKFKSSRTMTALSTISIMLFYSAFGNITGHVTATALLVFLGYLFFEEKLSKNSYLTQATLFAFLVAALASIKSNIIVACFFYLIFYFIISYKEAVGQKEKLLVIKSLAVFVLLTFIFLFPWMVMLYQSSGTLLYPIFGKGFHGSVYGTYDAPYSKWSFANFLTLFLNLANIIFLILFLLGIFIWKSKCTKIEVFTRLKSLILLTFLSIFSIAFLTAGLMVHYYTYPIVIASVIIMLAAFISESEALSGLFSSWRHDQIAVVLLAVMFGSGVFYNTPSLKPNLKLIQMHLRDNQSVAFKEGKRVSGNFASTPDERARYQNAQNTIPFEKKVLARTEKPFLFNLKQNNVYIIDLPGGASLPPGMPSYKGGEALSKYLLSNDIQYIVYTYATECSASETIYGGYATSTTNIWQNTAVKVTFDFNKNLKELGYTKKRIFDDGNMFVLDLAQPINKSKL